MINSLEDRMKSYEVVSNTVLQKKIPVLCRVDGKGFGNFTKQLKSDANSPWSRCFYESMIDAAIAGCKEIQGCKMAYVQSDEISFLITDMDSEKTESYFGYKTRKMNSVIASTVSLEFYASIIEKDNRLKKDRPRFDSRVWNLPLDEVVNCFVWRQQDAIRNSVQMLGRYHFSHRECNGKSVDDLRAMLIENDTPWENIAPPYKKGVVIAKKSVKKESSYIVNGSRRTVIADRSVWLSDQDPPVFSLNREYIENLI
jgi:tRNA(His) guanylyltransferase